MLSLAANALAFSPPASLSRRDVLSFGAGAVGAAAMVQFPTVANAADKPAYLMTDEEKEAAKKAKGIKIESEAERLERLGLKQATAEVIDSTYKVNNVRHCAAQEICCGSKTVALPIPIVCSSIDEQARLSQTLGQPVRGQHTQVHRPQPEPEDQGQVRLLGRARSRFTDHVTAHTSLSALACMAVSAAVSFSSGIPSKKTWRLPGEAPETQ